jgi:hypothetical protein
MLFQQKMPIFSFFFQKKHKYKGGRKVYNQKKKSMAACPGMPSTATVCYHTRPAGYMSGTPPPSTWNYYVAAPCGRASS